MYSNPNYHLTNVIPNSRIVIRAIPPSFSQENFLQLVKEPLSKYKVDHLSFIPKHPLYPEVGARCFITFADPDSVIPFGRQLAQITYPDSAGKPRQFSFEYAPSQYAPRKPVSDHYAGTLCANRNPVYASFLKSLEPASNAEVLSFKELSEIAKQRESQSNLINTSLVLAVLDSVKPAKKRGRSKEAKKKQRGMAASSTTVQTPPSVKPPVVQTPVAAQIRQPVPAAVPAQSKPKPQQQSFGGTERQSGTPSSPRRNFRRKQQ
ncbi:hypothetical protein RCL1_006633 [Eukaryota sp. TZLM3-RCL]